MASGNFGTRRTEIGCHGCNRYFSVELDYDVNGNHEVECPNCKHIHYRVIENGRVTGERYRSSMGMSYTYSAASYTATYANSYDTTDTHTGTGMASATWTTSSTGDTW